MKRIKIAFISLIYLVTIILCETSPALAATTHTKASEKWPKGPNVYADSAIVMEASTGLILYEKNIDVQRYPASITKIMTALLAIENSSLNDVVTFSRDAIFKVDLQSSRIGIDVGEKLTMQQCLYAMLLESANEVTYAVAEHVGGTIPAFAKMMNARAKEIGCTHTNFVNPNGLPDTKHLTTAHDMALITREAMKNETFRKIFGTRTYQIPPTNIQSETRYLRNHHKFVLQQQYRYDDCIGGKTGYTTAAKYTLVSVAKRGDLELICVVMKDDSIEHQYNDTKTLFNYAFDNFSIYKIADLESSTTIKESPLFTKYNPLLNQEQTPLSIDKKGYLILPNTASFKDAQKEVSFNPDVKMKKGNNIIGIISYTYLGKYVGGANILFNYQSNHSLTKTELATKNPTPAPSSKSDKSGSGSIWIILGVLVGIFVFIFGAYFVIIELPRRNRRKAYYRKRANRKKSRDDYIE